MKKKILFLIIIVVVFLFLGVGIHVCYKDPVSSYGSYCSKDPFAVFGRFNLETASYEMFRVVYVGTYKKHFVSLWSGSNISANPWFILSKKWVTKATACEIWDREQFMLNRYKEGMDSNPPGRKDI